MAAPCALYPSLRGKTVLITGGAEGIGAADAELFARQGCKVLILDIAESSARDLFALITKLATEVEALSAATGGLIPPITPPVFYKCDVSNFSELQRVAAQILEEHGVVHVLVNNAAAAGASARQGTLHTTPEVWEEGMNMNLRPFFFLTQAFVPAMKAAGGGAIVNMGSITWRIPATGLPVYTTAKAAILGLTRTHSKEFGPWNIRVNSVMPGSIATQRQLDEVLTPEYRAEAHAAQSLKRDIDPMEVAKVVVFLASDEASAVTGSSYVVDAGWCSDP